MKKYITSTLIGITLLHFSFAQGNSCAEITRISVPFKFFKQGSMFGKNLYFGDNWVKAKLLKADNSIVTNDSVLYNFDKIERKLLITTDLKNISEIDHREFKAVLFYWHDSTYIFKHINFINEKDLFQVIIVHKDKYSLFKVIRTKLIRSRVSSFLMQAEPSPYDRFEDIAEYYIFFPNKEYKTIYLPGRAGIKRVFTLDPDAGKVEAYLNSKGKEEFDENELIQLISYLNS